MWFAEWENLEESRMVAFKKYWKDGHEEDPLQFQLKLDRDEWDEQYLRFLHSHFVG